MSTSPARACAEYEALSRRTFLSHGLGMAARYLHYQGESLPDWAPRITLADPHVGPRGDTLVVIFLRGGADGLNIVVPHGDDAYYTLRPTLGIARPDDTRASKRALDLDGFFGLHPALEPILPMFDAGLLAAVHATGSPDDSRSHFRAMATMERGGLGGVFSGWLARHLETLDTGSRSALRAVAIGEMLPTSLLGTSAATALRTVDEYRLRGPDTDRVALERALGGLYGDTGDLTLIARQILDTLEALRYVDPAYTPQGRAYPENSFGQALQAVAQLVRLDLGVEVATVDFEGWDTHAGQGAEEGYMAARLADLAEGLAAFSEDLADHMDSLTLVVMSEFGRRARENGALGTDHGQGNMMLVAGGGIVGQQVITDWPGLQPEQLAGPGDLARTIDYRDVLGEIVGQRLNNPLVSEVFPGYTVTRRGITRQTVG